MTRSEIYLHRVNKITDEASLCSCIRNIIIDDSMLEAIRTSVLANKFNSFSFKNCTISNKNFHKIVNIMISSDRVQSLEFINCGTGNFTLNDEEIEKVRRNDNFLFFSGFIIPENIKNHLSNNDKKINELTTMLFEDFIHNRTPHYSNLILSNFRTNLSGIVSNCQDTLRYEAIEQLKNAVNAEVATYHSIKRAFDQFPSASPESPTINKDKCCLVM